jgi:hypothetical protein
MTAASDIVTSFMGSLERKNFDRAASYLAEDFLIGGLTPKPLDKSAFITVVSGLAAGIPNLSYHPQDIHEIQEQLQGEGSREQATIHITGHQTDSFILPPLGLPPIPQMGKSISLPEEQWDYTVKNGKIARIETGRAPDGGIKGLLHQLGTDIPIIQ